MKRFPAWVLLFSLLVVPGLSQEVSERTADEWVGKLGAESFTERKMAVTTLRRLGFHARAAVRAALHSDDPEVCERAQELWESLRWQVIPDAGSEIETLVAALRRGTEGEALWDDLLRKQQGRCLSLIAEMGLDEAFSGAARDGLRRLLSDVDPLSVGKAVVDPELAGMHEGMLSALVTAIPGDLPTKACRNLVEVYTLLWLYEDAFAAAGEGWIAHRDDSFIGAAVEAVGLGNFADALPGLLEERLRECPDANSRCWLLVFAARLGSATGNGDLLVPLVAAADISGADPGAVQQLGSRLVEAKEYPSVLVLLAGRSEPSLRFLVHLVHQRESRTDEAAQVWLDIQASLRTEEQCYSLASLMESFNDERAERIWDQILLMAPEDSVYDANAYFKLGPYYERRGQFSEAADIYEKGLGRMTGALLITNPDGSVVSGDKAAAQIRANVSLLRQKAAERAREATVSE